VEDFAVFLTAGLTHLVAAPIKLHDTPLGAVQLLSSSPLNDDALDVLQEVVHLITPYIALFMNVVDNATGERISQSIERVAEAVIRETGIEGVCDAVVEFARGSMGIDAVVVRVLDSENNDLRIEYKHGHVDPSEMAGESFNMVQKRLIPMAISREGSLIVDEGSPEVFNDPEFIPLFEELPSMLITPLLDKGEVLGTIEFYSLNEYAYKTDHLRNVEYVANLLTSAVAHFRLIRSLSREAEIRGLLADVARLASAADKLTSLVKSISPRLQNVIPVDRVTYFMPSERISAEQLAAETRSEGAGDPNALARLVVTGPEQEVCHGTDSESGSTTICCGAENCVAAMLWDQAEDQLQGWIHLERAGDPFTNEERELVSEFARHISPAIDTALSHEAELRLTEERSRAERAEIAVQQQIDINEAKQNFIATVSHELRTPLTPIRSFADLLSRNSSKTLTDKQLHQVAIIRRNSEWLNILINDLLDLSSIDSGRFEVQYQDVDIADLLPTVFESFRPLAETAKHEFKVTLPHRSIKMSLDPNRFSQVLGNLITNAVKFSPEGSPIRLLARCVNGGVSFYIRDEGPGIPLNEQNSVFERYVRADSEASRKARGTGIGLYVAKMIVESHGGRIGVTSVPGDHTTMYFWLPCERQPTAISSESDELDDSQEDSISRVA
jgi:signal transduction histidine kinase